MTVHIIYENFLKPDGEGFNIGGIETYILNLSNLFNKLGYSVNIYQKGIFEFEKKFKSFTVIGVEKRNIHTFKYKLFNACRKRCKKDSDIIIFASDEFIIKTSGYKTMSIQHGISWDIPQMSHSSMSYLIGFLRKLFLAWRIITRVNKVGTLVCVDYNFVNWYRALTLFPKTKLKVITNFTSIPDSLPKKTGDIINIIFARRFQPYRGTRLFSRAIERILREYSNINVLFAGEGPDESYIHSLFDKDARVKFTKYNSNESLMIHSKMDIAVVPTIGSEGTSLSLLEAMAARCAVVATNVGGLTNILIDKYNGLLIDADEESLYLAIKSLIDSPELRLKLSNRGYETVSEAFSLSKWETEWKNLITSL